MMRVKVMILLTMLLVAIDQGIKLAIFNHAGDVQVDIFCFLGFKPTFNERHSYINTLLHTHFNKDLGLWPHIFVFLIIQVLFLYLYALLRNKTKLCPRVLDYAMVFQFAAMICALLGNLVWTQGTLDYLLIKDHFVFDLKDLYVLVFIFLFLVTVFRNRNAYRNL